ncbi:MAG: ATP-binding protein [Clostridiales bacterium]|nr:ATP-binding protein [Clostridiales bacterium]
MDIKRDVYLQRLIDRMDNGSIKVITGIRRSGKSYLLNTLFYNYLIKNGIDKKHIIKFAFDSAEYLLKIGEDLVELEQKKKKVNYKKFMFYLSNLLEEGEKYYILLDEVQRLEGFEYVLMGYMQSGHDIYVTGSNSKFLSSDVITEFRGRGDEVRIRPLSFSEYYNFVGGDKAAALEEYMVFGGLPKVALAKTNEEKTTYFYTQMTNTYIKDVIERNNFKNVEELGELLNVLASGITNLTNPTRISNIFKTEKHLNTCEDTVSRYIKAFEEAFIVSSVLRYDVKGMSYISTPYKIYFEDIGLRNSRLNFRQVEFDHIMENVIYNELRYRGYMIDVGDVNIREKNKENKEIKKRLEVDFVVNKGSQRVYIQSAFDIPNEEKWIQETKSFDNIPDSFKKVVIVNKPIVPRYTEKGYYMIGLTDFLLDIESI